MIILPNGHKSWFFSASGAMAYLDGWPWEQPLKWLGIYDTRKFTIITKTLTWARREGNLKLWKWWRCIRFLGQGNVVNSVGLTNPGITAWTLKYYPKIDLLKHQVIVSVLVDGIAESDTVMRWMNGLKDIVGVQLNISCPNIEHEYHKMENACTIAERFARGCKHPVILKLGYQDDFENICKQLDGSQVAAFELINAVPWNIVYEGKPSPLAKYGLMGAVSGPVIAPYARAALRTVRLAHVEKPIISGGGIRSLHDVEERYREGANGFALGTHFMTQICKTNRIIDGWMNYQRIIQSAYYEKPGSCGWRGL